MTEGMAEMHYPGIPDAIETAAIRVAEFVLRLLSAYLVYCFGLPSENFEQVKEN